VTILNQEALKSTLIADREVRGLPADEKVRIGHVVSVSGSHAVAVLERTEEANLRDKDPRIQVGGVVRIQIPGSAVIGLISAISAPMPEMAGKKYDIGLIEINLTGEICPVDDERGQVFRRGVTCLPSLGDAVLMADRHDLESIFAPSGMHSIKIGTLYQDAGVPARLMTDDLLRKHFIVVGSTGSGKSCALTGILQRLLEVRTTAHVVILDVHNEYSTAFGDLVERITLSDFNLPLWMLNFRELCVALTSDDGHQDDEIEILNEGVLFAKKRYAEAAVGRSSLIARKLSENVIITADTPAPFRVSDVIAFIQNELGKLERTRMIAPYRRLKAKLEMLAVDQRYNFMFGSLTVEDTMTDVLSRLFRIPNNGRPISVIDLSTVPHEILDVVISVIARLAFDLAVWSEGGLPMLIVCEEAHRYVPANGADKFVPTRTALGRIAKEGRKYGHLAGAGHPAPLGAGHHHPLPVQHRHCAAPRQREGPAGDPRQHLRGHGRPDRLPATAGGPRGDHPRPGHRHAHAYPHRRPRQVQPAQQHEPRLLPCSGIGGHGPGRPRHHRLALAHHRAREGQPVGRLMLRDALAGEARTVKIGPEPVSPLCEGRVLPPPRSGGRGTIRHRADCRGGKPGPAT
jgi:hypothetical protein